MVKASVVGKGAGGVASRGLASRLGKLNTTQSNAQSSRAEVKTGLLSAAMKKAMAVQKPSKDPLRSITARLGQVGKTAKSRTLELKSRSASTSTSEGIFAAERNINRASVSLIRETEGEEGKKWRHDLYFASGQARGLPAMDVDEGDAAGAPSRAAARRTTPAIPGSVTAFRAAVGAVARAGGAAGRGPIKARLGNTGAATGGARSSSATPSGPRIIVVHKKGRGNFTFQRT